MGLTLCILELGTWCLKWAPRCWFLFLLSSATMFYHDDEVECSIMSYVTMKCQVSYRGVTPNSVHLRSQTKGQVAMSECEVSRYLRQMKSRSNTGYEAYHLKHWTTIPLCYCNLDGILFLIWCIPESLIKYLNTWIIFYYRGYWVYMQIAMLVRKFQIILFMSVFLWYLSLPNLSNHSVGELNDYLRCRN